MARAIKATTSDGASDTGSIVILVLLAAFIPAGCVLWFLNAAMENQQLAVRQRLTDVYKSNFDAHKDELSRIWGDVDQRLERTRKLKNPSSIYKLLVDDETCDAVIVYDDSGRAFYPTVLRATEAPETQPDLWAKARQLEDEPAYGQAAEAYGAIARSSDNVHLAGRAVKAQIRCLVRAKRIADAVSVIYNELSDPKYRDALDAEGRLIAPAGQLLALQIGTAHLDPDQFDRLAGLLVARLWDENETLMPLVQRRFLIGALREIKPDAGSVQPESDAALRAHRLDESQRYAEIYLDSGSRALPGELTPLIDGEIWAVASSDARVAAVFKRSRIEGMIDSVCNALSIRGCGVTVKYAPASEPESDAFVSDFIGPCMPGWRISMFLRRPDPFQAAADKQKQIYFITAGVAIGLIVVLSGATGRYVRRQMKLTRLKNDLIATVSHELKTPLASMRVLIDTLVEGRINDKSQADEYLQLIARENLRLSRLIENFLTFSRMERNRRAFEFERLYVDELIAEAIESTGDRFLGDDSSLEIDIADDLPPIAGDRDAMITVILNLLDNAWKYSGDDRKIRIKADLRGRFVRIKVIDNGIGMPTRIVRRVFERFYQADLTLTRSAGGCGLGLSIVKFILDAHRATIEVVSRSGSGSTFIVKIPAQPADEADE
jgi:signal transduction histidine kinase